MGFGTKVTLVVRKDALSMNKLTEMVGTDKFCFEINKTKYHLFSILEKMIDEEIAEAYNKGIQSQKE